MDSLTEISGTGTIFNVNITGATSLTTLSTSIGFYNNKGYSTYQFFNCALNAASVNHLLISLVENYTADTNGDTAGARNIDLSNGTSAGTSSLTAEGLAARDALVADNWVVTLNA